MLNLGIYMSWYLAEGVEGSVLQLLWYLEWFRILNFWRHIITNRGLHTVTFEGYRKPQYATKHNIQVYLDYCLSYNLSNIHYSPQVTLYNAY